MPVFVSHSHRDGAVYSAVCLALDSAGIERWDVTKMSLGGSLSGQLRQAISDCGQCVFIATRRSIESQWCLAELGAFWGAGKTVILFLADPDLEQAALPPQFRDNLMANDAHRLISELQSEQVTSVGAGSGVDYKFFPASGDYGRESDWLRLLHETDKAFDILGISLGSWRRTKGFAIEVRERAAAGCKVRILCMDAKNTLLKGLLYSETDYKSVVRTIDDSRKFYEKIAKHPNVEFRQLKSGMPHFFLTRTDATAIVIQYLSSQTWGSGPTWQCDAGSDYYGIAKHEFDTLWDTAAASVAETETS